MNSSVNRLSTLVGAIACAAIAGAALLGVGSIPAPGLTYPDPADADRVRRIEEAVAAYDGGHFWGGVVVARQGEIIFAHGYGEADDAQRPIDTDSLFDIGSVTKQFTAAAILRLEMDGRLSTSDAVSKFFPDAGGRADQITLHHLLTHTSGMSDYDGAIQSLDYMDRDEAVRLAMACPERNPRGAKFEYSNGGYVVLGAVIELASGRLYDDYVRDTLFRPAGMTSTGFIDGKGLDPARQVVRETTLLKGTKERVPLFESETGEPWAWGLRGAGGVLTTVGDMVKWDRALESDTILNAAARAKLYRAAREGYAYGWKVEPTVDEGLLVQHGGGTRGFRCHYIRYLKQGIAILTWSHETSDPGTLAIALARIVVPEASHAPMNATLHTSHLVFDAGRTAIVNDGIAVAASRDGPGVRVVFSSAGTPCGTVVMPRGWAVKVATGLEGFAGEPPGTNVKTTAMVMTRPYSMDADGEAHLPDNLEWTVGRYNAMLPDGTTSGQDRVALSLGDKTNNYIALIAWLPPDEAGRLAAGLRAACGE